jgi:hypothetical protein
VSNEAMTPLKFQKEIKIGFKKMNDAEAMDARLAGVFFYHYVGRLTPSRNRNAPMDHNIHEL